MLMRSDELVEIEDYKRYGVNLPFSQKEIVKKIRYLYETNVGKRRTKVDIGTTHL